MVSGQALSALFGRLLRPLGSKYEANTFDVSFCYGLSGGGPEDYVGTNNSYSSFVQPCHLFKTHDSYISWTWISGM